ncbi:MAG: hypothetical protein ABSG71_07135 [Thermodesulfobacteriota bacterium]
MKWLEQKGALPKFVGAALRGRPIWEPTEELSHCPSVIPAKAGIHSF